MGEALFMTILQITKELILLYKICSALLIVRAYLQKADFFIV